MVLFIKKKILGKKTPSTQSTFFDTHTSRNPHQVLPALAEETPIAEIVGQTEEARQMRTDRLDAGDENAALSFVYKLGHTGSG